MFGASPRQPETRLPVFAGAFYPDSALTLRADVLTHLEFARGRASAPVKALIAPHAGYCYSGPIAGSAFNALRARRGKIGRVVALGPSHRVAFKGIAAPTHARFATPLGVMPVDHAAINALRGFDFVEIFDPAHAREHSIEVLLPFLQVTLGDVPIIPLVVGMASPEQVSAVLEELWRDDATLPVISSDLSHFLDYEAAAALDARTTSSIIALDGDAIEPHHACGQRPIRGLLQVARERGLKAEVLDQRSSGDTAGSRDSVVGYGAYALV